jgi:hypothetical protein
MRQRTICTWGNIILLGFGNALLDSLWGWGNRSSNLLVIVRVSGFDDLLVLRSATSGLWWCSNGSAILTLGGQRSFL